MDESVDIKLNLYQILTDADIQYSTCTVEEPEDRRLLFPFKEPDFYILELVKDNQGATREDPTFRTSFQNTEDQILKDNSVTDKYIAKTLNQQTLVLNNPLFADVNNYMVNFTYEPAMASEVLGTWEFIAKSCVDRR